MVLFYRIWQTAKTNFLEKIKDLETRFEEIRHLDQSEETIKALMEAIE